MDLKGLIHRPSWETEQGGNNISIFLDTSLPETLLETNGGVSSKPGMKKLENTNFNSPTQYWKAV